MRSTLEIADDVHAVIEEIAARERRAMGKVLSDLIRDELLRSKTLGSFDRPIDAASADETEKHRKPLGGKPL
ncbi:MAG: hypothetical protein DI565_12290 [Ancylobacter novellus]|uniref:Uncharacterized protein n=1 Tax=Ancylobacter novellus TaxID=921 RepID=A0A2W5KAP8_ANCNO|nr:MAG: hypothetical protein DI565_12290 [Ancylobacter novellus]